LCLPYSDQPGTSYAIIGAAAGGVSHNTVRSVLVDGGNVSSHGGNRKSRLSKEDKYFFNKLMLRFPKMRLCWYARFISVVIGKPVSVSTISRTMLQLRLSFKKPLVVYSEALTDAVYQSQEQFKSRLAARLRQNPRYLDRCIWVDVTGFNAMDMYRQRGIAPVGQPFVEAQPSDRLSAEFGDHHDCIAGINRISGVMGGGGGGGGGGGAVAVAVARWRWRWRYRGGNGGGGGSG
jgi:hypothetical protein